MKRFMLGFLLVLFLAHPAFAETDGSLVQILSSKIEAGKVKIESLVTGKEKYSISESMQLLNDLVVAATERASLLATWDAKAIESEAIKLFDETIMALEEYLKLVDTDGPVNKAVNRIKAEALAQASNNRAKASQYKSLNNIKFQQRYEELTKTNDEQAKKVDEYWQIIVAERAKTKASLEDLKLYKQLYVDLAVTEGIQAALDEMVLIAKDLRLLSSAMDSMKEKLLGTMK
ncbi:MAG: hypothetical protein CVV52_03990 [Spirochaetae bacterium HGW-Spirochaetae-8]|jgi:hypothetical protein|nr:MAG: hypothetical protein CVV52_03990 [Spirochaetae bacterium HGW-Spirochaetae-8]